MQTIDKYELRQRLGSGAFATVWLAYDPALDGQVAIKLLGDNWVGQPDIVRRFLDEARLLWRAEDSRVVDVYTVGELETGQPWFAMQYADRGTLRQRLDERRIPATEALGLIREMAQCVHAVHRLDAVHRDVKPENFLIRSLSQGVSSSIPGLADDERLMIADLGLAKLLATSSGFTIAAGSPLYMAPEQQSTSADIGLATDVYALGVCAWEVLTGTPPEPHARAQTNAAAVDGVSPEVAEVLRQAMAEDPASRWPDVPSFVSALTTAARQADAQPTLATKPTPAKASTGLMARVGVGLAVLAAVVGGVFVATRGGGADLSDAPAWFELPAAADAETVSVTSEADAVSIVAVMPAGFAASCQAFVDDGTQAGYGLVLDECAGASGVASLRNDDGETAVIAQLSNGRVGWQFDSSAG